MSRLLVIVNGRLERDRRWRRARARLQELFADGAEIFYTRGADDAEARARAALQSGARWLAAAGGDGTIHQVVNGCFEGDRNRSPDTALSFIPCGTANDWARTLGIPMDASEAVGALARFSERLVDVGLARFRGDSGEARTRVFLNYAEAGIGSEVVRRRERTGAGRVSRGSYLRDALLTALTFKARRFRLLLDGVESLSPGPLLSLIVSGGQYFGGGIRCAPMAKPDDGVLDMIALGNFGRAEILLKIRKFIRGEHMSESKVLHRAVRTLEAGSDDPVRFSLDGEAVGMLPASIRVLPEAMRIRC